MSEVRTETGVSEAESPGWTVLRPRGRGSSESGPGAVATQGAGNAPSPTPLAKWRIRFCLGVFLSGLAAEVGNACLLPESLDLLTAPGPWRRQVFSFVKLFYPGEK